MAAVCNALVSHEQSRSNNNTDSDLVASMGHPSTSTAENVPHARGVHWRLSPGNVAKSTFKA